jgi:hypothetical protein
MPRIFGLSALPGVSVSPVIARMVNSQDGSLI